MKILIVDDDEILCQTLRHRLSDRQHIVDIASDGQLGWEFAHSIPYNLIILDVMLPQLDGVSLCQRLRAQNHPALIMLFTSRGHSSDQVRGFAAGADDYVIKPIELAALEARIQALLRRQPARLDSVLKWGQLRLDWNSYEVSYQERPLTLTAKEFALLELLLRHPQRVFSQNAILQQLWSLEDNLPDENTVRVHIKRLRQKLKAIDAADLIETMYGLGYRLNPKLQLPERSEMLPLEQNSIVAGTLSPEPLKLKLIYRVETLEKKVAGLFNGNTEVVNLHQQIQQDLHRLIGSLGMFGLLKAVKTVRSLESYFSQPLEHLPTEAITELMQRLHAEVKAVDTPQFEPLVSGLTYAKVLVVDDDCITLKLLKKLLEPWGLQVTTLENPLQVEAMLEVIKPDLLILDVQMPGVDGIALCHQLRNDDRWLALPILFLTGQRDSETIQQIFMAGADDYVTKPVLAPELIARLFNRLERTRLLKPGVAESRLIQQRLKP